MELKCIHCGTEIDETDCIDLSYEGDYIIAKKVGETVHKYLRPGLLGIGKEQFFSCFLASAVLAVIAGDAGSLNGRRNHHRAGIVVFFQRVQNIHEIG